MLLTKALASGLTDHIWSILELLSYRVAPLLGLNQNDEDVPSSWQHQKQAVKHCQVYNRACGPCFVCGKEFYA